MKPTRPAQGSNSVPDAPSRAGEWVLAGGVSHLPIRDANADCDSAVSPSRGDDCLSPRNRQQAATVLSLKLQRLVLRAKSPLPRFFKGGKQSETT